MANTTLSQATGTDGSAPELHARLNDPAVADSLNRLLDRLDSVAFFVESIDGFVRRGETIIDSISAAVDDLRHSPSSQARQLFEQAPEMLKTGSQLARVAGRLDMAQLSQSKVLERLTDKSTLDAMNRLLDQLPLIAFLMDALKDFLERGETVADNLAGVIQELHLKEMDPAKVARMLESLPKLQEAGEKLLASDLLGDNLHKLMEAGNGVLASGMLDKQVVSLLGQLSKQATTAYSQALDQPVQPVVGIFGMLKALKDPDVQKMLGLAVNFARAYSQYVK